MFEARPARHAEPAIRPHHERRHLTRVSISIVVVVAASGGVIAQMDRDTLLDWILRVSAIVGAMILYQEIRLARQMDRMRAESWQQLEQIEMRIEARLSRPEYWKIYSDVLADLGGIDGENSGEIPTGRGPRR